MTVYNTLNKLVEVGVVTDIGRIGDGFAHFDADTSAHINLACTSCKEIVDIETEVSGILGAEVEGRSGYHIKGSRLLYFGVCPDCQNSLNQA
jgi:Fur family peroxide stress response transcriptional regulator